MQEKLKLRLEGAEMLWTLLSNYQADDKIYSVEEITEMFNKICADIKMGKVPLESIGDFAIYQLKEDISDYHERIFEEHKPGQKVRIEDYEFIYEGYIEVGNSLNRTLDDIFYIFNMQHPSDYKGHSLSVSDVVRLNYAGEPRAYFVSKYGFEELKDFDTPEKKVNKVR